MQKFIFIPLIIFTLAAVPVKYNMPEKEALERIAKSLHTDITFENYSDRTGVTQFAYNLDVDTAAPEIVRASGGSGNPVYTAASTLTVVSSSANDTGSGTGARTIGIVGLNGDYSQITDVVTLNGQSNVSSNYQFIAVNRVYVLTSGSGKTNAGNITITHNTDAATIAYVPASGSVSESSVYTVPANYMGYIESLDLNASKPSAGSDPEVTYKVKVHSKTQDTVYEILRVTVPSTTRTLRYENLKLEPLRAKETIWVEATTNVNDTQVNSRYNIILGKTTLN